jgi:S-disulfanyl-L-cysteine oxidoreductase SoxD
MSLLVMPLRIYSQDSRSSSNKTVWDGVFSEDQARWGRASHNASCASCHRDDLTGYEGALKGQKFVDRWREDALESLYSNIKRSMPRNAPGSLETATYLDIVAYILQQNGFPAGVSDLSPGNLKSIQVTGKNGTESLPIGALVQVYGCIRENPANAWTLAGATKVIRTRNPDKSSDADLKQARSGAPRRRKLSFSRRCVLSPGTLQGRDGGSEGFSCCGSEGRHQRDITRVTFYSLSLNT